MNPSQVKCAADRRYLHARRRADWRRRQRELMASRKSANGGLLSVANRLSAELTPASGAPSGTVERWPIVSIRHGLRLLSLLSCSRG
jgi:hypothetical protein